MVCLGVFVAVVGVEAFHRFHFAKIGDDRLRGAECEHVAGLGFEDLPANGAVVEPDAPQLEHDVWPLDAAAHVDGGGRVKILLAEYLKRGLYFSFAHGVLLCAQRGARIAILGRHFCRPGGLRAKHLFNDVCRAPSAVAFAFVLLLRHSVRQACAHHYVAVTRP